MIDKQDIIAAVNAFQLARAAKVTNWTDASRAKFAAMMELLNAALAAKDQAWYDDMVHARFGVRIEDATADGVAERVLTAIGKEVK